LSGIKNNYLKIWFYPDYVGLIRVPGAADFG